MNVVKKHGVTVDEKQLGELGDLTPADALMVAEYLSGTKRHLQAAQYYIQAQSYDRALSSLIETGDLDRIVTLVKTTGPKHSGLYTQAIGYLSGLEWRANDQVLMALIDFHTKLKLFEELSSLYGQYANYAIDQLSDYALAENVLKEGRRALLKIANPAPLVVKKIDVLQCRLDAISQFVHVQRLALTQPDQTCDKIDVLLADSNVLEWVGIGDMLGLAIDVCVQQENLPRARAYETQLKQSISAHLIPIYLDAELIGKLHPKHSS
jgi:hypothetical protein